MYEPPMFDINVEKNNMQAEIDRLRGLLKMHAAEIEKLRAALKECAANYMSPPCTIAEGHIHLATEFQRRMNVAGAALGDEQSGGGK